ncbi:conserved hypothetical protein [Shewanella denitrificans OS217]|uniref:DUF3293 domain-containing protein n=1 Tax=Shewanella denitrificans (strain OS217 / ATCC BAA-1090 / DSM 15013) TaxID=318161 RepID=Q12JW5_SHEDO|nr:DUF3293 domain-containing protein [Shewanella denitrificans]ABE56261.1 conserved hypothetical protein [Shewanella denitrificans OS217]
MKNIMDDLWRSYQNCQFLLTQPLSPLLSLSIVTAHNPLGKTLSPSQNRLLDRQLQAKIQTFKQPYRSMITTSEQMSHMEKSWAIFFLGQEEALALGQAFQQLAIYHVEAGELSLMSCVEHDPRQVHLGPLYKRLKLVNELPELNR